MSSLKLPLRFLKAGWDEELRFFFRIEDADNNVVALTPHLAEVIVAALEADAELGVPICECCTKKGTEPYWHQECDCMNQGDLADAAGWCAVANLLERKPNTEKGEQGE